MPHAVKKIVVVSSEDLKTLQDILEKNIFKHILIVFNLPEFYVVTNFNTYKTNLCYRKYLIYKWYQKNSTDVFMTMEI